MKRSIKIIHDGSLQAYKMRVVDANTGEQINLIRRVEIVADARRGVEAVLYIAAPELEIETTVIEERTEGAVISERVASEVETRISNLLYEFFGPRLPPI